LAKIHRNFSAQKDVVGRGDTELQFMSKKVCAIEVRIYENASTLNKKLPKLIIKKINVRI